MEAFSQEKDELILVFAEGKGKHQYYKPFFIKATLRPDFTCLCTPESFERARRNSINLFADCYDQTVLDVFVYENERAIGIRLSGGGTLVLKLFGNRSNILYCAPEGQVVELFIHRLEADAQLLETQLHRPIEQHFEAFVAQQGKVQAVFPTFGKLLVALLDQRTEATASLPDRWAQVQTLLIQLENPRFFIVRHTEGLALVLVPMGEVLETFDDPLVALNRFYTLYIRSGTLEKEKASLRTLLQKRLKKTQAYLNAQYDKLDRLDQGLSHEQIGHLLMANLHAIPERAAQVELYDFYHDRPVTIKLKEELSPQKNAEQYYRKAKNEKIATDTLYQNIAAKEQEVLELQAHLSTVEQTDALRALRTYTKKHQLTTAQSAPTNPSELFKQVYFQGFEILIGRNAKNNDLLTKHHSYKEDLWLHARDVSGSHVLIKHRAGKPFPPAVIERAAELAAWYSKRRTDSLCPVIVTPKKYVRKPKGMAEGAVIVEKEEVVMVVPRQ